MINNLATNHSYLGGNIISIITFPVCKKTHPIPLPWPLQSPWQCWEVRGLNRWNVLWRCLMYDLKASFFPLGSKVNLFSTLTLCPEAESLYSATFLPHCVMVSKCELIFPWDCALIRFTSIKKNPGITK